ncbi:FecR family protein [Dyadobacter soli]|uniref:FecR family protein n=1 Tax=Dyadobacter soli TaxID=659014 RepID=A0A1G7VGQ7_9BACT|nr:FecR family protein [Dyadobacter soli]SDG59012.1 FecR family protein [Dyadobacter soli]
MEEFYDLTVGELLVNEAFRDLVLHPTPRQESEFRQWMEQHPAERGKFLIAADTIRAVGVAHIPLSEAEQSLAVGQIFERTTRKQRRPVVRTLYRWGLAAAAVVAVIIGFYLRPADNDRRITAQLPAQGSQGWKKNSGQHAALVQLGDGSSIFLQPGSAVRIPDRFAADSRQVELQGEAFFEVAPDRSRPFFVYANETVTKVLGTSFSVSTNGENGHTVVGVRTGKVEVSVPEGGEKGKSAEIVPGQQASLGQDGIALSLLGQDDPMSRFLSSTGNGDAIDVAGYLAAARLAFGVNITFDAAQLKSCKVRANFEGMHLVEQIEAICKAINATYKVSDGQILIVSPGC